jgi:hypothetical protein
MASILCWGLLVGFPSLRSARLYEARLVNIPNLEWRPKLPAPTESDAGWCDATSHAKLVPSTGELRELEGAGGKKRRPPANRPDGDHREDVSMYRSSVRGIAFIRWPAVCLAAVLVLAFQPGWAQDTKSSEKEGAQAGESEDFDYAEYWFAIPEPARAFYASGLRDGINLVVANELTGGLTTGLSEEVLTGTVRRQLQVKWRELWVTFDGDQISNLMNAFYEQPDNANVSLDTAAKMAIDQLVEDAPEAEPEAKEE